MNIKAKISRILPQSLRSSLRRNFIVKRHLLGLEMKSLNSLKNIRCDTRSLKTSDGFLLTEIFNSDTINSSWKVTKNRINSFDIPDFTGGVNPGDRRALYYLIRYFKPNSILEIGTHIGASTVNIASALHKNYEEGGGSINLQTLDIKDVNSTLDKPWLQYGTKNSPLEMIINLKFKHFVDFKINTSINYLQSSDEKFDFIFLDGDHSAATVYKEIPLALKRLNPNGIILLHDYFPNGKPLWSNKSVLPGPFLATERHLKEGAEFKIIPIGALPWKTKLDSNYTSLALLLGNHK